LTINNGLIIRKLEEAKKLLAVDELSIPTSALCNPKYAPLEAIVLYLREDVKLKNIEVARLLKRSAKSITQAYTNAKKK